MDIRSASSSVARRTLNLAIYGREASVSLGVTSEPLSEGLGGSQRMTTTLSGNVSNTVCARLGSVWSFGEVAAPGTRTLAQLANSRPPG
jgi:hypothetical protein